MRSNAATIIARDAAQRRFALPDRAMVPASYVNRADGLMAKKKKVKPFRATTAVKALAREKIGAPPPSRAEIPAKRKPPRHKPTLPEMLSEE